MVPYWELMPGGDLFSCGTFITQFPWLGSKDLTPNCSSQ